MAASRLTIWLLGLACLSLVIFAGHLHPLAYLVLGAWLPLPVFLVGWQTGKRAALGLALAAALLVFAVQPGLKGIQENLSLGELLLMGVLLSSCRNRGLSAAHGIIVTTWALALVALLFLLGKAGLTGQGPLELFLGKARATARVLDKVLAQTGVETRSLLSPGLSPADWETMIVRLYPALFVINTALVAWLNTAAARSLARLWKWDEAGPPLSQWCTPEWLIFLFLGTGFLLLVPHTVLRLISVNLLLVLGFLYFSQGVAVVADIFQRFQMPRVLRLPGYALLFINPLFLLTTVLGLADLWLDFRRLHRPRDA